VEEVAAVDEPATDQLSNRQLQRARSHARRGLPRRIGLLRSARPGRVRRHQHDALRLELLELALDEVEYLYELATSEANAVKADALRARARERLRKLAGLYLTWRSPQQQRAGRSIGNGSRGCTPAHPPLSRSTSTGRTHRGCLDEALPASSWNAPRPRRRRGAARRCPLRRLQSASGQAESGAH
jgi:hypothetical protein